MAAARRRVVSVRLTRTEHERWTAVRSASPWTALAHWARELVARTIAHTAPGQRPGAVARFTGVPPAWLSEVVSACAHLNDATRASNGLGVVLPDAVAAARSVVQVARRFDNFPTETAPVFGRSPSSADASVSRSDVRPRLVNIWLTEDEFSAWSAEARADGFPRTSAWVRALIDALVGVEILPPPRPFVPDSRQEAARHFGGAVTNISQLGYLDAPTATRREVEALHVQVQDVALALRRGWA